MSTYRVTWTERHQAEIDTEAEGLVNSIEAVVEWVEDNLTDDLFFVSVTEVEKL